MNPARRVRSPLLLLLLLPPLLPPLLDPAPAQAGRPRRTEIRNCHSHLLAPVERFLRLHASPTGPGDVMYRGEREGFPPIPLPFDPASGKLDMAELAREGYHPEPARGRPPERCEPFLAPWYEVALRKGSVDFVYCPEHGFAEWDDRGFPDGGAKDPPETPEAFRAYVERLGAALGADPGRFRMPFERFAPDRMGLGELPPANRVALWAVYRLGFAGITLLQFLLALGVALVALNRPPARDPFHAADAFAGAWLLLACWPLLGLGRLYIPFSFSSDPVDHMALQTLAVHFPLLILYFLARFVAALRRGESAAPPAVGFLLTAGGLFLHQLDLFAGVFGLFLLNRTLRPAPAGAGRNVPSPVGGLFAAPHPGPPAAPPARPESGKSRDRDDLMGGAPAAPRPASDGRSPLDVDDEPAGGRLSPALPRPRPAAPGERNDPGAGGLEPMALGPRLSARSLALAAVALLLAAAWSRIAPTADPIDRLLSGFDASTAAERTAHLAEVRARHGERALEQALREAVRRRSEPAVRFLLEAGGRADVAPEPGDNAAVVYALASQAGDAIVGRLLDSLAGRDPACGWRDILDQVSERIRGPKAIEAYRRLKALGADLSVSRDRPFRSAVAAWDLALVRELAALGAGPSGDHSPPIYDSVWDFGRGPEEIARLIDAGIPPDFRNAEGANGFHALAACAEPKDYPPAELHRFRELFAPYRKAMNRPNGIGRTPLRLAMACDHRKAFELLLALGADPDAPEDDGVPTRVHAGRENRLFAKYLEAWEARRLGGAPAAPAPADTAPPPPAPGIGSPF